MVMEHQEARVDMGKDQHSSTETGFFRQLMVQLDQQRSPADRDRYPVRILCGRWLALRRTDLGISAEDAVRLTGIDSAGLAMLEAGLAERSQASDGAWERLTYALASCTHDLGLIRGILAAALGTADPSPTAIQRVLDELPAVADSQAEELPVPPEPWRNLPMQSLALVQDQASYTNTTLRWLKAFASSTTPSGRRKTREQRWRDALAGAEAYAACGGRDGLMPAAMLRIEQVEQALAHALVGALHANAQATRLERRRVASHLAALGDPRPGVITPEPAWCGVIGRQPNDPGQCCPKPAGFRIARYPITNAQWHCFMAAGGYTEREWWLSGWELRSRAGWTHPRFWYDPAYNQLNQPVVGISWYEAHAFCRWLTSYGHQTGWLHPEERIQLPNEHEWTQAAYCPRGACDIRCFPWGEAHEPERANTCEGAAGHTTPVGCYPQGASPCGALDMVGNIWEWCAPPWSPTHPPEHHQARAVVCMGGSWNTPLLPARVPARCYSSPETRQNDLGLRVIASAGTR